MPVTDVAALKVWLDHDQERVRRERLASVAQGAFVPAGVTSKSGWSPFWGDRDPGDSQTFLTWVDPITSTLMLTPAPLLPGWASTGTGIYARLAKANFTLNTPSLWYEAPKNGAASKYLVLQSSAAALADRSGVTTADYPANQPVYISWFDWNWGGDKVLAMAIGYGATAGLATATLAIAFYRDGQAEVWVSGSVAGTYPYTTKDDDETSSGASTSQRFVSAMIFPMSGGILVVTNQGGGFFHSLEGADENDPDQVLSPAGKLWFQAPVGKVEVEMAPIQFPTAAYRAALKTVWLEAPEVGEVPAFTIYSAYSQVGAVEGQGVAPSLQQTLAAAAFVPDGVTRDCRVRLDLTGGPSATPYIFGVTSSFEPLTDPTDDSEKIELTPNVTSLSLAVPEDPGGVQATFAVRDFGELDPEGLSRLDEIGSRPVALIYEDAAAEEKYLLDGISQDPDRSPGVQSWADRDVVTVRDWWGQFERITFSDDVPLDGMPLGDALDFLARSAGLSAAQIDIGDDANAYDLPLTPAGRGDWTTLIKRGDSVAKWVDQLHEQHCPTYYMAIRPSADPNVRKVFTLKSPEELGREPKTRIFRSIAWAKTYVEDTEGLTDPQDIRWVAGHRTYRNDRIRTIQPESNDIWVMGVDRKTLRPMLAHYPRREAQDVTAPPSERVAGWRGLIAKYGLYMPSLNSKTALFRAAKMLFKRLCFDRRLIEWESDLIIDPETLLPCWRGDVIELQHGQHTDIVVDELTGIETEVDVPDLYLVRIRSFDMTAQLEIGDASAERPCYSRPTRYTGEILAPIDDGGEGEPKGSDGLGYSSAMTSLSAAVAEARAQFFYTGTSGPEPPGDGAKPPIDVYLLPDDDEEDA
jgi:hypothetical protein